MRPYLKGRYLAPALVALVMIIYGAFTSVRNTSENLKEFDKVDHTRVVLIQLGNCLSSMLNLETGYRGYLLTGSPDFLEPYQQSLAEVDHHIDELARLTRDNPVQQDRLELIRESARLKKEELARGIVAMDEHGRDAAAGIVSTRRGKELMDEFRVLISQMHREESDLLQQRRLRLSKSIKDTNTIVVTTGGIAVSAGLIGVLLLVLYLMSKERQERLQFEKEKAQQADKAKTEFLAMMSHEIRTPMNAILGFGELLRDAVHTPQEKHYAKAIVSSGNSLLSLINDILDLSKIEAEKLELHEETVEMKRFVENLETLFSFRAQEKGLAYSIRLDPSVPGFLLFDALRLRQILINLIGNAVKFTRDGSVTVNVRATPGEGDAAMLHFEVADTGIGIAPDRLGDIFRPFYQVESEQGRHFQGTGLGLSISERLASLMGGKIEVRSEVGKGSFFHVSVPARRCQEQLPARSGTSDQAVDFNRLAPSRILVVDDVPLNRELIIGYLAGSHHQVLEAENGEQAVILCSRHLPEIVLMDVRMPLADGRAALKTLKSQETTRHIPLVAVTASSLFNREEELRRTFDGFATKPVSRERLFLELSKFLPSHSVAATGKPVPQETSPFPTYDRSWPELRPDLEKLRDTMLPGLIELVPAQATARFADDLSRLAVMHDCAPLDAYATQLANAAGSMEFNEARSLLECFPGLIESLCHADL